MPFKNPHPLYNVWRSMRDRCMNPNFRQWDAYGGRGISICERWNDFHAFVADMGPRPPGYSLDRIDNDGDYTPENCRWADRKTQQRNQRRAVYVDIEGFRYRAIELAELAGVKTDTIVKRAKRGLSYEQVVSPDPMPDISGFALGAQASAQQKRSITHCPTGHEYTEANTIISKQGWRRCRKCFYAKERERLAKKRAST